MVEEVGKGKMGGRGRERKREREIKQLNNKILTNFPREKETQKGILLL